MHLMRYMPCDHPINFAWCCERGREKYKVIPLTCNMGFMEKATVHSSSLDQRDQGDGEVTQTSIYNYHKEGTGTKSFCDTQALRFAMPLSHLLPTKNDRLKTSFQGFAAGCVMEVRSKNDTPTEPLPAIFWWWDVSCFFKHRLQNRSHVVSSSAEGNDCGLAGKAASEYRMNVPVKHTTLRCYGPGRALVLLLIMPFGVVDSQGTHHSDTTYSQGVKMLRLW